MPHPGIPVTVTNRELAVRVVNQPPSPPGPPNAVTVTLNEHQFQRLLDAQEQAADTIAKAITTLVFPPKLQVTTAQLFFEPQPQS